MAIDGEALKGGRKTGDKGIVHMVSAWAKANHLALGQRKVDDKSNEITAIPKLLEALARSGTVVAIDAMGCQRTIADKIVDKKADRILAVKDNQQLLLDDIQDSLQMLAADTVAEQIDCGHGGVERRTCAVPGDLSLLDKAVHWSGLRSVARIPAQRFHKASGKTEQQTRYYVSSLPPDAARLNGLIRQHWGIESKLHWVLDGAFNEDHSRKPAGHAAQNFSLLNPIALNSEPANSASTASACRPPGNTATSSTSSEWRIKMRLTWGSEGAPGSVCQRLW